MLLSFKVVSKERSMVHFRLLLENDKMRTSISGNYDSSHFVVFQQKSKMYCRSSRRHLDSDVLLLEISVLALVGACVYIFLYFMF